MTPACTHHVSWSPVPHGLRQILARKAHPYPGITLVRDVMKQNTHVCTTSQRPTTQLTDGCDCVREYIFRVFVSTTIEEGSSTASSSATIAGGWPLVDESRGMILFVIDYQSVNIDCRGGIRKVCFYVLPVVRHGRLGYEFYHLARATRNWDLDCRLQPCGDHTLPEVVPLEKYLALVSYRHCGALFLPEMKVGFSPDCEECAPQPAMITRVRYLLLYRSFDSPRSYVLRNRLPQLRSKTYRTVVFSSDHTLSGLRGGHPHVLNAHPDAASTSQ